MTGPLSAPLIDQAVAAIRQRSDFRPRVAIILGTGLGQIADEMETVAAISYHDIPFFPRSTALAHKGLLRLGTLAGVPVVTMQGRCHFYEGYPYEQLMLPTRVMHALGAETLIVTNAAGGVNPHYAVGDVMAIADHINLQYARDLAQPLGLTITQAGRIVQPKTLYDAGLLAQALRVARGGNFPLQQGVYLAVTGPNYETRAEYRCFRRLGADAVGMSTVPEVLAAVTCGMRVLGMSTITNIAKPDSLGTITAEEVVAAAEIAGGKVRQVILGVLETLRPLT
jgi:purine-nucleoside phosphorylase